MFITSDFLKQSPAKQVNFHDSVLSDTIPVLCGPLPLPHIGQIYPPPFLPVGVR